MSKLETPAKRYRIAICVCLPFALAFVLTTITKTINAVQAPQLMHSLNLSLHNIGLISAFYLLGYGLFQLPLGTLLDRYGPRRMQAILLLFATLSLILFATAHSVYTLAISRILIGMTLAGGLTAALTANAAWFPYHKLAIANSVSFIIGSSGALLTTYPLHHLLAQFGWRYVNWGLAWIALATAIIIFFITPKHRPKAESNIDPTEDLNAFTKVFRDPFFWRIAPFLATTMGFFIALQGLWAGAWLRDISGFSHAEAAHCLLAFALAMVLGLLATGISSYFVPKWRLSLMQVMLASFLFTLVFEVFIIDGNSFNHYLLWFGYGFFVQFLTISFTIISNYFSKEFTGRATTALVFALFIAGFIMQYMIGTIVTLWPTANNGAHPLIAYRVAFSIFVVLQVVAFIWMLLGLRKRRHLMLL